MPTDGESPKFNLSYEVLSFLEFKFTTGSGMCFSTWFCDREKYFEDTTMREHALSLAKNCDIDIVLEVPTDYSTTKDPMSA